MREECKNTDLMVRVRLTYEKKEGRNDVQVVLTICTPGRKVVRKERGKEALHSPMTASMMEKWGCNGEAV